MNGRFANTAFCILAPDGEQRLTRSGRGPEMALSRGGDLAGALDKIAARYPSRGDLSGAAVPDFPSFKLEVLLIQRISKPCRSPVSIRRCRARCLA